MKSVLLLLLPVAWAATFCPPCPADPLAQTAIFEDFVNEFFITKNVTSAFLDHVDPGYIQHNPFAAQGRDAAISILSTVAPVANYTIIHSGFDNNTGYVHYRLDIPASPPTAVVDVFRFNGTCIMEHWDVAEAKPANATNPLALW